MPLIVYLDEAGDHSLEREDKDFPIFVLVMLICNTQQYVQKIIPAVYQLKLDYFGHEGVILHSRDIRKAQGAFAFLSNPKNRPAFYQRINDIMGQSDYTLIASVIRKQEHKSRYGKNADNPYDLALEFALERLVPLLETGGYSEVQLIAESRGKREDDELRLSFYNFTNTGTGYVSASRFRAIHFRLDFLSKSMNIVGTQLADLAAYPIARYVLDSTQANPAYEVIRTKFYKGPGLMRGLKIFPKSKRPRPSPESLADQESPVQ
jgi:hypothetical protein